MNSRKHSDASASLGYARGHVWQEFDQARRFITLIDTLYNCHTRIYVMHYVNKEITSPLDVSYSACTLQAEGVVGQPPRTKKYRALPLCMLSFNVMEPF